MRWQLQSHWGANVTVLDLNQDRLDSLVASYKHITAKISSQDAIAEELHNADLVIGAVLVPGAKAPKIVTTDMVKTTLPGSVIADVAIDQGGCIEESEATDFSKPIFVKYGVIHQCITNLSGAVPRTSTFALNNV